MLLNTVLYSATARQFSKYSVSGSTVFLVFWVNLCSISDSSSATLSQITKKLLNICSLIFTMQISTTARQTSNRPFQLVHFVFPFQTTWCPHGNSFCFFISYAYICTCIRRHFKETIPSSSITWSEMGKQNVQAEKVYCMQITTYISRC